MERPAARSRKLALRFALAQKARPAWQRRQATLARPYALQTFLRHVVQTVPLYRSVGADVATVRLRQFPIVSRRQYDRAPVRFRSTSYERTAPRLLLRTSGTTGRAITVRLDPAAWYEVTHAAYAAIARLIPEFQSAVRPGRLGVAFFTTKQRRSRTSLVLPALDFALFERYIMPTHARATAGLLAELRDITIPLLSGKPSSLVELMRLDQETAGNRRITPRAILVSGENLFGNQRRLLQAWFGCKVYNAYTSAEGGLIASECTRQRLHVNSANVVLEVLCADGRTRSRGRGELVLTNLMNWSTVFVRYRTGDRGTLRTLRCSCGRRGPVLTRFYGREASAFSTGGRVVRTTALDRVFEALGVESFQIARANGSFTVQWVPPRGADEIALSARLLRVLTQILDSAPINCRRVATIPRTGSKMRRYIDEPDATAEVDAAHRLTVSVGNGR